MSYACAHVKHIGKPIRTAYTKSSQFLLCGTIQVTLIFFFLSLVTIYYFYIGRKSYELKTYILSIVTRRYLHYFLLFSLLQYHLYNSVDVLGGKYLISTSFCFLIYKGRSLQSHQLEQMLMKFSTMSYNPILRWKEFVKLQFSKFYLGPRQRYVCAFIVLINWSYWHLVKSKSKKDEIYIVWKCLSYLHTERE